MKILKYITSWKYRFFLRKIRMVSYSMAETEFKIAKSRQIREGVRQDRERVAEAINQIKLKIEAGDKNPKLEEEVKALEENKTRYEKQMEMIDHQINGYEGDETHEPIIGKLEELNSLNELKNMYTEYISKI